MPTSHAVRYAALNPDLVTLPSEVKRTSSVGPLDVTEAGVALPLAFNSCADDAELPPSYTYTWSQHDSVLKRVKRSSMCAKVVSAVILQAQSRPSA